jgi:hypothetical protein
MAILLRLLQIENRLMVAVEAGGALDRRTD